MSLKQLYGIYIVSVKSVKMISPPHVVLHPVSGICSSQSISCPKCPNKTSAFERHPSIVAKTTGETELSSHAPPRPQKARLKMCGKLKLVTETFAHHFPKAKTPLLTTQSAKSTIKYDFRGDCQRDLQQLGNTKGLSSWL